MSLSNMTIIDTHIQNTPKDLICSLLIMSETAPPFDTPSIISTMSLYILSKSVSFNDITESNIRFNIFFNHIIDIFRSF